jgi:hypothetical protein
VANGRLILVDGSNVRRSAWPNPTPDRLVAALDAWAGEEAEADDRELVVVFDGSSGAASTPRVAVVDVPYADDELVAIAREAIAAGWVVDAATSDRELRDRLQDSGATVAWGGGRLLRELGLGR